MCSAPSSSAAPPSRGIADLSLDNHFEGEDAAAGLPGSMSMDADLLGFSDLRVLIFPYWFGCCCSMQMVRSGDIDPPLTEMAGLSTIFVMRYT